jgi:hypothetical protein
MVISVAISPARAAQMSADLAPFQRASPANGAAKASSAVDERPFARSCSWAPWWPNSTTPYRLTAAGKPKMVALIAIARKLLTILNAILRDNRTWQIARQRRQSLSPQAGRGAHIPRRDA